jgi:3-hydroxyisobutyrate dehydrogenase-like beta-hydroxyacid dehydrogenase
MTNLRTTSVAMIGLGNMGSALAESLLANEFKLTAWNRTQSKAGKFVSTHKVAARSIFSGWFC